MFFYRFLFKCVFTRLYFNTTNTLIDFCNILLSTRYIIILIFLDLIKKIIYKTNVSYL